MVLKMIIPPIKSIGHQFNPASPSKLMMMKTAENLILNNVIPRGGDLMTTLNINPTIANASLKATTQLLFTIFVGASFATQPHILSPGT